MEEIKLYTPFLVAIDQQEMEDKKEMMKIWKRDFLVDTNLETWTKIKEKQNRNSSTIKKVFKLPVLIFKLSALMIKWCWPILLLSIVAYFGILSSLILSIALIPIQIFIWLLGFIFAYNWALVAMAFILDEKLNAS